MGKNLFIAEKPSVAKEFAKVLNVNGNASKGYLESDNSVVTLSLIHIQMCIRDSHYQADIKRIANICFNHITRQKAKSGYIVSA